MPTYFNIRFEYDNLGNLSDDRLEQIMTQLAMFHPSIGGRPGGGINVRLTFPAESAPQAAQTALAVVGAALSAGGTHTGPAPIFMEVMTEEEFDRREGWEHIPELVSVAEAAEILHVSPQRIRQMIDEGKFHSVTRIGERSFALARAEVDKHTQAASPFAAAVETDRREGESPEDWIRRIAPTV